MSLDVRKLVVIIGCLVVLLFLALNSFFIVNQIQQVVVLRFGQVQKVVREPGFKIRVPFIDEVKYFDKRLLNLIADSREVIAADQKRIIVNAFAKYRIIDPLKFYQTVRNEDGIRRRLNSILESSVRQVLGEYPLSSLLTKGERTEIMGKIQKIVNKLGERFGVEIKDVRIMRTDLPVENSEAIYRRMQTEREREAKEFRAQGEEQAQKIRAKAERERVEILSNAYKESEILRGQGDATATKVYISAFSRDRSFFEFYRSMQAYKKSLKGNSKKLILSSEHKFLKELGR